MRFSISPLVGLACARCCWSRYGQPLSILLYAFGVAVALGLVSVLVGLLANKEAAEPVHMEHEFQLARARCVCFCVRVVFVLCARVYLLFSRVLYHMFVWGCICFGYGVWVLTWVCFGVFSFCVVLRVVWFLVWCFFRGTLFGCFGLVCVWVRIWVFVVFWRYSFRYFLSSMHLGMILGSVVFGGIVGWCFLRCLWWGIFVLLVSLCRSSIIAGSQPGHER